MNRTPANRIKLFYSKSYQQVVRVSIISAKDVDNLGKYFYDSVVDILGLKTSIISYLTHALLLFPHVSFQMNNLHRILQINIAFAWKKNVWSRIPKSYHCVGQYHSAQNCICMNYAPCTACYLKTLERIGRCGHIGW